MTLGRLADRLARLPRLRARESNLLGFFLIGFGLLSVVSLVWIFVLADGPTDLIYQWPGLPSLSLGLFFLSRVVSESLESKAAVGRLEHKAATGLLAFAWLVCLPVFLIVGAALWYQGWGILGVFGWLGFVALVACIALVVGLYSGTWRAPPRNPQRERPK